MKKELVIPEGINVDVTDKKITVNGKLGKLEKEFKYFHDIKLEKQDNKLTVSCESEKKKVKAMIGTIISHTKNLIQGVTAGYTYKLKAVYTHFPMTSKVEGNRVVITNFLGEKTSRTAKILEGVKVEINGQDLTVTGNDLEKVAQTAANIETATKITKKDRRIFQDMIAIVKGKA
ncbi:MAG: 50S ribosomal protein L6 [Candidatus Aenigmarchaeota archaeon]|nr:50S ribosomal protein L6 [Candidatus Aenigmarchaeota archaeon]